MQYKKILILALLLLFTGCLTKGHPPIAGTASEMSSPSMSRTADMAMPPPAPVVTESTSLPKEELPPKPLPPKREVQSGMLTAGEIDDNLNLDYFQKYVDKVLQRKKETPLPFISTKKRLKLKVVDSSGQAVNGAKVLVGNTTRYTNSAGTLHLFPSVDDTQNIDSITVANQVIPLNFDTTNEKTITLSNAATAVKGLDLMFVIDTTGSMSDEMEYLAKEFESIVSNIKAKYPNVNIRFGLTLYKDKGDDYVVKDFAFTTETTKMKEQLAAQSANGGGDYPEAMDKGIQKGLETSWAAEDGVRIMFLVADAPPHDEDMKKMLPLIKKARDKAVRIYPIGASGVGEKAEFIMRHLALLTEGRHLFLTDDSGIGNSHEEPKVACYQVTRLDQLIRRILESELSGKRVEASENELIRTVGHYDNGVCTPSKVSNTNN